MTNVIPDAVREAAFTDIKLTLLKVRAEWEVLRKECPVKTKGALPYPNLSRCAGVINNLDGPKDNMRYCLFDICPKVTNMGGK